MTEVRATRFLFLKRVQAIDTVLLGVWIDLYAINYVSLVKYCRTCIQQNVLTFIARLSNIKCQALTTSAEAFSRMDKGKMVMLFIQWSMHWNLDGEIVIWLS